MFYASHIINMLILLRYLTTFKATSNAYSILGYAPLITLLFQGSVPYNVLCKSIFPRLALISCPL